MKPTWLGLLCACALLPGAARAAAPRLKATGRALSSEAEARLDAAFNLARESMDALRPGLKELEDLRTAYIEDSDLPGLQARRDKVLKEVQPRWQEFLRLKKLYAEAKAAEQRSKFAAALQGFMADRSIPADAPKQFARANGIVAFDQDMRSFKDWGENVFSTEETAFKAAKKAYEGRRRALAVAGGLAAALLMAAFLLWRRRSAGPAAPAGSA